MTRRKILLSAAMAAAVGAKASAGTHPTGVSPKDGVRGTNLAVLVGGPFDTSGYPNGVRPLSDTPVFATSIRIQVNPGQQGKIAIGGPALAADSTGDRASSAFIELWPNWDGAADNGRSDKWILDDPRWLNTIDLSQIYVWPEIPGEMPVVAAYQLV